VPCGRGGGAGGLDEVIATKRKGAADTCESAARTIRRSSVRLVGKAPQEDVPAPPRADDGGMDFLLSLIWTGGSIGVGAVGALLLVAGAILAVVDDEAAA
jgi:hypothetical protein